jgi:hypothetical protein
MRKVSKRQILLAAVLIIAAIAIIAASQFGSAGAASNGDSISLTMSELAKQGVPVESWRLDGTSLSVSLASKSTTEVGTPDDPINLSLVEREAFLAKSRGVELSELKLDVTNANGKSLFAGTIVLDKTLDVTWASAKALSETETLAAVQSGLAAKTDLGGLTVKQFELSATDGARELRIAATASDVKSANESTAALMTGLYGLLENLNAGKQAQIALARVQITDESGQPLLNWIYDGQRHAQNWWQAEGMTTEWFETPGPETATAAIE